MQNNPNSGQVIEMLIVADQEDVEWWSDKLTEVAPQGNCNYFVMNRSATNHRDRNATFPEPPFNLRARR